MKFDLDEAMSGPWTRLSWLVTVLALNLVHGRSGSWRPRSPAALKQRRGGGRNTAHGRLLVRGGAEAEAAAPPASSPTAAKVLHLMKLGWDQEESVRGLEAFGGDVAAAAEGLAAEEEVNRSRAQCVCTRACA